MTTFEPRPDAIGDLDYRLPSADEWFLTSGVRVVHLQVPGRLLSLALITRGGTAVEAKAGVAALTSRVRKEGTAALTVTEFAEALDAIGAELAISATLTAEVAKLSVPARFLAPALELLAATATSPRLDPAEVDKQRAQQLDLLRQTQADPAQGADLALATAVFADDDPRHRPVLGTPESIASLTVDDVRAHATRWLIPDGSALLVVGDVTRDELTAAIGSALTQWSGDAPSESTVEPARPAAAGVTVVAKPGAPQTPIRLGAVAPGRDSATWPALSVAAHLLGGSLNSRLSAVLREEKGYTYGVTAVLKPSGQSASLEVALAVDSGVLAPALTDLRAVLARTLSEPIPAEEIDGAVAELLGRDAMRYQTAAALAAVLTDAIAHDLPLDWLNAHRERLRGVTTDEVSTALRGVLDLEAARLAFVGDPTQVAAATTEVFPGLPERVAQD